jgi:hypothetical protein
VFRPDSSRTAHLRRALARRKKTNRIDAEVLAKLAVWNRGALHELELPTGERACLDRLVRATERLTEEIAPWPWWPHTSPAGSGPPWCGGPPT